MQHKPDLFGLIRVLIDEQRRQGDASGKFLLLGSVVEKLQGQSESLAGRVMEMQLHPFNLLEALAAGSLSAFRAWQQERPALGAGREEDALMEFLRQRGGYPESLLAGDEESARKWRHSYLRTVIRKDAKQSPGGRRAVLAAAGADCRQAGQRHSQAGIRPPDGTEKRAQPSRQCSRRSGR